MNGTQLREMALGLPNVSQRSMNDYAELNLVGTNYEGSGAQRGLGWPPIPGQTAMDCENYVSPVGLDSTHINN